MVERQLPTAGPWHVEDGFGGIVIVDGANRIVCEIKSALLNQQADAQAIAAVPELLEALNGLAAFFDEENYPSDMRRSSRAVEYARDGLRAAVIAARKAIAKAEGREVNPHG